MIELKNVSKYYNSNGNVTIALRNINLKLSEGEIVAIVGESGAGKSTLLNVICGVDSYEDGEIYFNGQETSYFNKNDMDVFRKNHIGFIYQSYNIIDSYTVLENVMLPLILKGENLEDAKTKALTYIEKVGLSHRVDNKGTKLSGGEKQRCVIARALAQDFKVLACDEPTGNLDSETGRQIIELIKEVAKDKLVLIVTHNYEQVEHIVTRTIKVSDSEIVSDIKKEEKTDDKIQELNLVETKNKFKSLLTVGYFNIKNTPKKTIFTSIVFTVFSFVLLFLLMTVIAWNDINKFNPNEYYYNTVHERIIVYNEDYSAINLNDFKDFEYEYYKNPFYEDMKFAFRFVKNIEDSRSKTSSTLIGSITSHLPYECVNVCGNYATEGYGYIVFPVEMIEKYSDEYSLYIDKYIQIDDFLLKGINIKLSGFGYSDTVSNITLVTPDDYSSLFYRKYLENFKMTAILDGNLCEVDYAFNPVEKPILTYIYNKEVEITDLQIILKSLYYINITDFDVRYVYNDKLVDIFIDLPNDYKFEDVFELSVYSNDLKTTLRKLDKMGYMYRLPGKNGVIIDSQQSIFFMLFCLVSVITLIILFFVTFVIISKIAISKLKDYTILRSNGVLKASMKNVVHIEMISIGLASAILAYIIFVILSIFVPTISKIGYYNNILVTLAYFLLILVFDYFISRRLNKKIFKNTVAGSFKSEVTNND